MHTLTTRNAAACHDALLLEVLTPAELLSEVRKRK